MFVGSFYGVYISVEFVCVDIMFRKVPDEFTVESNYWLLRVL
jgi:hypothetical protein